MSETLRFLLFNFCFSTVCSSSLLLLLSDADIPLDMGVICCSPQKEEPSVTETPTKEPISRVQSTPPPKKNKVQKQSWKNKIHNFNIEITTILHNYSIDLGDKLYLLHLKSKIVANSWQNTYI